MFVFLPMTQLAQSPDAEARSGAAKLTAASYGRDYTKAAPNFQKSHFMENWYGASTPNVPHSGRFRIARS
jgi:hypothetical protein